MPPKLSKMERTLATLDRLPINLAAITSVVTVGNSAWVWLSKATDIMSQLTAILGLPIAICMLIYWIKKARKE